jgi:outer membrane protein assembly factor BamD (BamD/ComL family)
MENSMKTSVILVCLFAFLYSGTARAEEHAAVSLYRQGKVQYDNNRFDQALATFDLVIRRFPENPVAEYAANLSLDILNLKKDYAGLEKLARRYAADEVLMRYESLREVIGKLLPQISLKKAQQLLDKKKYPEAAKAFLKVAAEFPKSDIADSAVYNAALCYEKAKITKRSLEIHRRLIREYPQSPLARRSRAIIEKSEKE